jgi:hypothetical protein
LGVVLVINWIVQIGRLTVDDRPEWRHVFGSPSSLATPVDFQTWKAQEDLAESRLTTVGAIALTDDKRAASRLSSHADHRREFQTRKAQEDLAESRLTTVGASALTDDKRAASRLSSHADHRRKPRAKEVRPESRTSPLDGWSTDDLQFIMLLTPTQQRDTIRRGVEKAGTEANRRVWQRRLSSWVQAGGLDGVNPAEVPVEPDSDDDDPPPTTVQTVAPMMAFSEAKRKSLFPRQSPKLATYGLGMSTDTTDMVEFRTRVVRSLKLGLLVENDLRNQLAMLMSRAAVDMWESVWTDDDMTNEKALDFLVKWEKRLMLNEWKASFYRFRVRTLPPSALHEDYLELKRLAALVFDDEPKRTDELYRRIQTAVQVVHGDPEERVWEATVEAAREAEGVGFHLPSTWASFVDARRLDANGTHQQEPSARQRGTPKAIAASATQGGGRESRSGGRAAARDPTQRRPRCYNCGRQGHLSKDCKAQQLCWRCFDPGHTTAECKSEKLCRICRKPGHIARDCTQKQHSSQGEGSGLAARS